MKINFLAILTAFAALFVGAADISRAADGKGTAVQKPFGNTAEARPWTNSF